MPAADDKAPGQAATETRPRSGFMIAMLVLFRQCPRRSSSENQRKALRQPSREEAAGIEHRLLGPPHVAEFCGTAQVNVRNTASGPQFGS